jgi:hypothetical protein
MKKAIIMLALVLGVYFPFIRPAFAASSEQFNQATVTWQFVSGAKCYNIYYKRTTDTSWKHSVRCLPKSMWTYTIGYLKLGVSYVYTVSALNDFGKEISWTKVAPLVTTLMVK